MLKWAKNEDNLALQDVFSKVFEVSSMWTSLWKDFGEEYCKYRKSFKEVLQQEKVLDEARKREAMHAMKMNKVKKQLDQTKRKSDGGRPRTLSTETVEVISQAEQEQAELEVKTTKHEIFKARKLRDSLYQISDGLQHWASKTLLVAEAYRKLANLITDTPTQLTETKVFHGAGQTRTIVSDLARDIQIDPELSRQLAAMSQSARPYLYAVSTPMAHPKHNSAKYDYADAIPEQKPSKANGILAKPRRAPEPLPHQHLKVRDNLGVDPNIRRPLSLTDLRPPPTSPPPPLPKNAKQVVFRTNSAKESISRKTPALKISQQSPGKLWYARKNISSDSDSDSEGYTEPFTDPSFFQRNKMFWKVLSDGAINEVGMDYCGRESAYTSTHLYHQLERNSQENVSNEPATYLDLVT